MRKFRAAAARPLSYIVVIVICLMHYSKADAQSDSNFEKLNSLYVSALRSGNNFIVNLGKNFALFDQTGKPLTPFVYQKMSSGFNGDVVVLMNESRPKLLDANGHVKTIFNQQNVFLRSATKQYVAYGYENAEHLKKCVYNEQGTIIADYTENPNDKKEIIYTGDYSKAFIRDTNGQFILHRPFNHLDIGTNLIVATSNDSSFIINKKGRILFQTNGKKIIPVDDNYFAIHNKVFWLLMDSNGKRHTNERFYALGSKVGIPGFANADNNIILTATGKPIVKDEYIHSINKNGNWYELDVSGSSENLIVDENLKLLFKDQNYEEIEFIGPRFVSLAIKYSDPNPLIYDRVSGKKISLRITQHIRDDFYFTEERKTHLKRLIKGVKQLPVTPFQNIEEVHQGQFYQINNKKPVKREQQEGSFYLNVPDYAPAYATGMLDLKMKEIIPMKYRNIEILSNNIILTTDALGHQKLFDEKGRQLYALETNQQVYRSGAVIHIYSDDGSILLDSLGKVLYKGKANIQLLFAERGDLSPTSFPSLLMFEDSSGIAGVYNLKLQQILPHYFHKVSDKMNGTFALKKGDSVYYINSHGNMLYGGRGFQNQKMIFLPGYALVLQNEAKKYGTMSPDGNIILPFDYDTVYAVAGGIIIGKQGQFAMLNDIGELQYPMQPWAPVAMHQYGFLKSSDGKYYAVINGHVTEVNLSTDEKLWQLVFRDQGPFITIPPGNEFNVQTGIYNSSRKRIADYTTKHGYRIHGVEMLIPSNDSNKLNLIDTSGEILIAGINKKAMIQFYNNAILVVEPFGTDELYRREAGVYKKLLIDIFEDDEQKISKHFKQNYNLDRLSIRFKTDGLYNALITSDGLIFMDPKVENIILSDFVYLITYSGKYGLMDFQCNWIQTPDADSIIEQKKNVYTIFKNNKKGLYNLNYLVSYIAPSYDHIYNLPSSKPAKVRVVKKDNKFNLVDQQGNQLLPWMDSISININTIEHTVAYLNGKEVSLGYNDDGEVIIDSNEKKQVQYESISGYREHVAIVSAAKQYGLYNNKTYQYILPIRYDAIKISEKRKYYFAWRYKADKLAGIDSTIVVNQKGDIIIRQKGFMTVTDVIPGITEPEILKKGIKVPTAYRVIKELSTSSLWLVEKNNKKTLANHKGKILFSPSFTSIESDELEDNYLLGAKDVTIDSEVETRYALLSPKGKVLSKAVYEEIEDNELSETCAKPCFVVLQNDLYGIINDNGKQLLEAKYGEISGVYNNQIALVKKADFWGAINLDNGKVILDFQYDEVSITENENLQAKKGNESIYFDQKGTKIIEQASVNFYR